MTGTSMTPADQRVLQLLAKWQTSLELHARYATLPDEQYWLVQPWPRHQRPTRWVVDLAVQRITDLKRLVDARIAAGDSSLCEALELMGFLTNLVGSQHIERFIPLAEPAHERTLESLTIDVPAPATAQAVAAPVPAATPVKASEVPKVKAPALPAAAKAAAPVAARPSARQRQHLDAGKSAATKSVSADEAPATAQPGQLEVIADAVRLLRWGRQWHELPDSIARMAGRPAAAQVTTILRAHRAAIEQQARTSRVN
jgi:hypothetical protein